MFDKEPKIVLEPEAPPPPPPRASTGFDAQQAQKAAKHRQKAAQMRARVARLKTKIEKLKHLIGVLEDRAKKHEQAAQDADMSP